MLQYLVILLDDTSVSFCHYSNPIKERNLIPLDILKKGILWATLDLQRQTETEIEMVNLQ